jgi:streptogramin lyase
MKFKNYFSIFLLLLGFLSFAQSAPTTSWLTQIYTGNNKTLANLSVTGIDIKWYNAPYGGIQLPSTTLLVDNTIYYATQTIGAQESSTRLPITVKRISDNAQVLMPGNTVANLVATPTQGASVKWYTTPTGGTALSNSTPLINGAIYYVEQTIPSSITTIGGTLNFGLPSGVVVQPDGKILVLDTGNGAVKRMNQDGTNVITLSNGYLLPVVGLALQTDGKILFSDTNGGNLTRINADGSNPLVLINGLAGIRGIAIQPDGKILVANPNFTTIKRYNTNGTFDVDLGSGFTSPRGVAIQQDGKIVVADFGANAIKRMNADGSNVVTLGSGFNQPTGVAIQMDGKILIGDTNNGLIKRMNADGTNIVTIASGFINPRSLTTFPNGDILATDPGNNSVKRIVETTVSNRVPVQFNFPPSGTHLNFDGVNDYVNIGNVLPANSSYTKEAWIYPTSTSGAKNILSSPSHVFWINDGDLKGGTAGNQELVFTSINENTWTHVALSYDKDTKEMILYKNGTAVYSSGLNNVNETYAGDINFIGSYQGAGIFNGDIDEVRVWNKVLTPHEIKGRRFCELSGNETGLVAYYKFNQGFDSQNNASTTSAIDSSGNNTGVLTNFGLSGAISNWKAGSPILTGIVVPSTPVVTTPQTFCTVGSTVASLIPPPSSTVKWYRNNQVINSTDNLELGDYYVTNVNANGCESEQVLVEINANIGVNVTSPINYELGEIAGPIFATGNNLLWYTTATGGIGSTVAPTPDTSIVGTTSYWVSETTPGCGESSRVQVVVNVVPITNNSCNGATLVNVGSSFNTFPHYIDLTGATDSMVNDPACDTYSGGDVWCKFIVPQSGSFKIETGPSPTFNNYDTVIALYKGSCGSLEIIDCNDDNGVNAYSLLSFSGFNPGEQLYVRMLQYNEPTPLGNFYISIYDENNLSNSNFDFKNLKIYPNPFGNYFKINIEEVATASIIDFTGKIIAILDLSIGENKIDLIGKPEGFYFLKIQNQKGYKILKMISK